MLAACKPNPRSACHASGAPDLGWAPISALGAGVAVEGDAEVLVAGIVDAPVDTPSPSAAAAGPVWVCSGEEAMTGAGLVGGLAVRRSTAGQATAST